ncbi:MAG: glycosyltransferase family 2 protein [Lentimicrobiaceae bacterium]|jgi:cellulose synthase/poly-beta-1,6-N-acetylglucosamine synthase-like glycosyltransferase|nr:glycosyltransferase family 2 protein [Lentimicrobiaceae bacterium]
MEILRIIILVIEILVFAYLAFSTLYIFVYGVASLFKRKIREKKNDLQRKFVVLIPGYKEDFVIVNVAKEALNQDYPKDLYEVIVIADSFKQETLDELRKLPIRVVEVVFEVSKKSKALNKCMEIIGDNYDAVMILDADNVMESNVIAKMNDALNRGYIAVQGHRCAKNFNTDVAILDALSEEINNNIFREGHRVLGVASALIGSGMAFDYQLYKEIMKSVDSVGEDKEVEMRLLKRGYTIEYLKDAHIYDEKTSKSDVFVNQRRRWLAAQILHFRDYFFDAFWSLLSKGNFNYFDKALQMVQPPRILLFGLLFILSCIAALFDFGNFFSSVWFAPHFYYWLGLFVATSFTLLICIPKRLYSKDTFRALFLSTPKAFFLMLKSLFKVKGAGQKFIHTTHSHNENKKIN